MADSGGAVLACDVGGTKLAAAMIGADGGLLGRGRIVPTPTGPAADGDAVFATLLLLARETLADFSSPAGGPEMAVLGVGVGCGGPMEWPAGRVSPLNMPGWREFPLRQRLSERLQLPVRLHNDAVCVAVGEQWLGAGRDGGDLLGMVISTGVGGGVVSGNRLINGATGNAGHIGHVVVDPDGPRCRCGGRGCLEAVASGPALAAHAREQGWRPSSGAADAAALAAAAGRGERVAVEAFRRAGEAVGVALASAVHVLDVRTVAIGGGVSQAGPLLFDPLREAYDRHAALPFAREVEIVPARLGQAAGLVGAAALFHLGERFWTAGSDA